MIKFRFAQRNVFGKRQLIDKKQKTHVAILKQRIYTKRLPTSFNLLDHSIDNIEKMLSQQPLLDENKRTTISNERTKMIAKYKYDMMALSIRTAEELFGITQKL